MTDEQAQAAGVSTAAKPGDRDARIDILRAIAMIGVVYGHVSLNPVSIHLWRPDYLLHSDMPLFCAVSGFLMYGHVRPTAPVWFGRRALGLLVPFFAWSIVYYFWQPFWFSGIEHIPLYDLSFPRYLLQTPQACEMVWYLWALPVWYLMVLLTSHWITLREDRPLWQRLAVDLLVVQIVNMAVWRQAVPGFGSAYIAFHYVHFAAGYLLAKYRPYLKCVPRLAPASLVLFALIVYARNYVWVLSAESERAILRKAPFFLAPQSLEYFFGCLMFFWVATLMLKVDWLARVFGFIGRVSIGIYCGHYLFRNLGWGSGAWYVLSTTVTATVLSIGLTMLLNRFRVTQFLFLGRKLA